MKKLLEVASVKEDPESNGYRYLVQYQGEPKARLLSLSAKPDGETPEVSAEDSSAEGGLRPRDQETLAESADHRDGTSRTGVARG